MFTLFHSQPQVKTVQMFSLFNIAFAAYQLYKTPDQLAFLTLEMVIEAATVLSLRENVAVLPRSAAVGLNLVGFGMYLSNAISPCGHGTSLQKIVNTAAKLAFAGQIVSTDDAPARGAVSSI